MNQPNMQAEFENQLHSFKLSLLDTYTKSQEQFEQKLTLITTSALGASIFLIEKLVADLSKAKCLILIVLSWFLLGASLLINLISHRVSAKNCYDSISEIESNNFDYILSLRRHQQIEGYNAATIWTLGFGILTLVLFSLINLYAMSN